MFVDRMASVPNRSAPGARQRGPAIQTHGCRFVRLPENNDAGIPLHPDVERTDLIAPSRSLTLFIRLWASIGCRRLAAVGGAKCQRPSALTTVLWTPPVFLGGGQLAHARR